MYGFFYNSSMGFFIRTDLAAPLELNAEQASRPGVFNNLMRIDTENLSGIILFASLNILLLLLNSLDLNHLCFDGGLPEGITHKAFVHDAIGILILSIVFAIVILLYYFRGGLNFYNENETIRVLAYSWIIQNVFMVLSTAYRNHLYISESGLSYKKIGVYVYLLLCISGLVITFIKLYKKRTNWYLIRTNAAVIYFLLIFSCIPNWDIIITDYNINKCINENKKLEKYFLVDISFKNLPQLLQLPDSVALADDFQARDYYNSSRNVYYRDFNSALDLKLFNFLKDYKQKEWQSYCAEKKRVFNEIISLKSDIKEMDLSASGLRTMNPIRELTALTELNLSATGFDTLPELKVFPSLRRLNLANNYIKTIDELPANNNLKELDLSQNRIKNYSNLRMTPSLEKLKISSNDVSNLSSLPQLNNLKVLDISLNILRSVKFLNKFQSLEWLNLSGCFPQHCDTFPFLPNLKILDLSSNRLNISQVRFFKDLLVYQSIQDLDLSNNPLRSLSVISTRSSQSAGKTSSVMTASFPDLTKLNASVCNLTSIYPLYLYPNIQDLDLSTNSISDINLLSGMPTLKRLNLSNNKVASIKPLISLRYLKDLDLSNNQLTSCSELANLISVVSLDISGNEISDISFLSGMSSLKTLNIKGNEIKNIDYLKNLINLEELTLSVTDDTDTSFLFRMKNLKVLNINSYFSNKEVVILTKALPDLKVNIIY
jgi:Leucine-rich repeat (LRR) protein